MSSLTRNLRSGAAIARNTFREAIRNKVLHTIILLAFLFVLSSLAIGQLSIDNDARVIRDIGVAFIDFTLIIVAVFSGVSLLQTEIKRKTIYTIVTKPVARWLFLLGRFVGLMATLLVVETLLATVLVVMILVRGDPLGTILFQALAMIFLEGSVVAALATLFSSFSTPILSGFLTTGLFIGGRLHEELSVYASASKVAPLSALLRGAGVVLPDLTLHRTDREVAYLLTLNWDYLGYVTLYSLSYAAIVLILASVIFSRRDFV